MGEKDSILDNPRGESRGGEEKRGEGVERRRNKKDIKDKKERRKLLFWNIAGLGNKGILEVCERL